MFLKYVQMFILSLSLVCGLNSPQKTRSLARDNYRLVPYFAKQYIKKYNLKKRHKEELIQYGYEGFMKACEKYDETRGFRLSTYSRFWVRKYMDDYMKDKTKSELLLPFHQDKLHTRLSTTEHISLLEQYKLFKWEKELLRRKYHNKETFLSIAKDFNMSRCTLRTTYNRIYDKIRAQSSL
jgi:RNA polymerase sigma factor (sigma-70 family)